MRSMRTLGTAAVLLATALTGPGLVHEFITGPGTVGSPADDPSVGYTSVQLDRKLDSTDYYHAQREYQALLEQSRARELARTGQPGMPPSAPAFAPRGGTSR